MVKNCALGTMGYCYFNYVIALHANEHPYAIFHLIMFLLFTQFVTICVYCYQLIIL